MFTIIPYIFITFFLGFMCELKKNKNKANKQTNKQTNERHSGKDIHIMYYNFGLCFLVLYN